MVVAGRQAEIETFRAIVQRAESGRASRGIVLTGLRGVGKTVLLNEMANIAEDRDWIVARLEVQPDHATATITQLVGVLAAGLRRKQGPKPSAILKRALQSIRALSLSLDPSGHVGASVEFEATGTGDLEFDLAEVAKDMGRAAAELGIGVAIFIDELQDMDGRSMASLCAAAHAAGQRDAPFVVVGAGLPNLPARLANAKSYAERLFDYRPLAELAPATAAEALAVPAAALGVRWADDALRTVVDASGGYPYFIQQFGASTWESADSSPIGAADAAHGVRLGRAVLDGGFFRARWDRATATERLYMRAMAALMAGPENTSSPTADIATQLERSIKSLGPVRAGLIAKGLIYAPEYGSVAFTVPGMADFIRRQIEQ
jgi:hypothetical protein